DKPNGTLSKVEFKVWQQVIWDENDTVLESQWYDNRIISPDTDPKDLRVAELAAKHAETPTIAHLDAMGRIFLTIAKNSIYNDEGVRIGIIDYPTRKKLDIKGNILETRDAGDMLVMSYQYNMLNQQLVQNSVDSGMLQVLNNVGGNSIRTWDSRGYMTRSTYDALQRLKHLFVSQDSFEELLVKYLVYGEELQIAETLNLRGNIYQHYDGVGVVTNEEFDFKGNLLRSNRRLTKEYKETVDWQPLITLDDIEVLLDDETFSSSTTYDALNRPTSIFTPHTNEIPSSEIRPTYNEANLLDKLDIRLHGAEEWTSIIININYNAKGQRELISYANGVRTKYGYDPDTFRLKHLDTTRGNNNRHNLQKLEYTYDPVGNIMEICDKAQRTIFYNNSIIEPSSKYEYDANYRLIQASGREHISISPCHYKQNIKKQTEFIQLTQSINNGQALRNYIEKYTYDKCGNLTQIKHVAGSNGNWKRDQTYSDISNRLNTSHTSCEGSSLFQYPHDANGNITRIPHLQALIWNYANQLKQVDLDLNGNKAYYSYNTEGQRVRKIIDKGNIREERIYIGNFEIYRKHRNNNLIFERQTLHIMDDQQRIAMIENRTIDTESSETDQPKVRIRYQLSNHLGSCTLEVDDTPQANIISYEEYYPYGGTSYICGNNKLEVQRKRYRYNGKERDDETGLYYYGARYYAPWMGRWVSCDPAGFLDGINLYEYTNNNPINFQDKVGTESEEWEYEIPHAGLTGEETVEERVEYLKKSGGIEVDLTKEHQWHWNEADASWEFRGSYTLTDEITSKPQSISEDETDFINNIESAWEQATTAEKVELTATGIGALGGLIPYIGDYISLLGSIVTFFANPSWETAGDIGLDTIGAILPFCPALGTIRRIDKLTDIADVAHDAEKIAESGRTIERVSDVTKTGKRTSRMIANPGPFPTPKNTKLPRVRGKRKKKPKLGRPGKAALQRARRRWFKDRVQHLRSQGTSESHIRKIIQGQILEQKLNPNSKIYSRLLEEAIKSTR
ncbi:MAG: RHS repeat domain-containing protein, partial [Candidatus Hermodarchaeota archaeon]